MAELDRLVCRFTTLDDFHLRMYGLENQYLDSSLNVLPEYQCERAGGGSETKASEMTVGEVAERGTLWEGDRLSLVYDFGTPSHYYCVVKEVYEPDEIGAVLDDSDIAASTETAAIARENRPRQRGQTKSETNAFGGRYSPAPTPQTSRQSVGAATSNAR